MTTAKSSG